MPVILQYNHQTLDLSTPKVMGIINLTPDSFYDGGKLKNDQLILNQIEQHLTDGATLLDLGAYSSRPGAAHVSPDEEKNRLLPIVELAKKNFPDSLISIDTFRAGIAKEALERGAFMINDISGGNLDDNMYSLVGKTNCPYVLMHMRGTPQTMQEFTNYSDVITEVIHELQQKVNILQSKAASQIIIDPGYGFSKTLEQNYQLLQQAEKLLQLNTPVLTGISRKSMIYKFLETNPQKALNGTTVLNTIAVQKGSSILRVHDVKEAVEVIKLTQNIK
ncbi:dihydropteroate synthase [Cyclobacteriaceae bacterium]|nr:dihydropteroate synthase [Cyclobacteriaceae bacterium]